MTETYDKRTNKEAILLKAVIAAVKGELSSLTTAEECRDEIAIHGFKKFVGTHVDWAEQKEGIEYWLKIYEDIPDSTMKKEIV